MWRDGAISIILLSTRAQGEELLELVREWTTHGILAPAAWVFPDRISRNDGPPSVTATLIDTGEGGALIEQEVDLFEMLALESMSRVRVVKLRSTSINASADELQDDASDLVAQYVAFSMPQANPLTSGDSDTIELDKISLICTPTQVKLDERLRGADADSSVVVVASPEDRKTPAAGDAFVRENERFAGFVLMHLATLAGLWRGAPVGTLELFSSEASSTQSIWIQRVFMRGVLTGGISRRAAADVLGKLVEHRGAVAAAGVTVTPEGTSVIPADRVPRYVDRMVETGMALDDAALSFREPRIEGGPDREVVGVWQQIGMFMKFSAGKLIRMPHWTVRWLHDLVARRVGADLQGADGMRQVRLLIDQEPDAHDRRLLLTMERLAEQRNDMSGDGGSAPHGGGHSAPRLWSGLRKLMFSAVDGSAAPPDGGFDEIDGRLPVFDSLQPVSPDPRSGWVHPEPPPGFPPRVTWNDTRRDRSIHERLKAAVEAATAAYTEAQTELAAANEEHTAAEAQRDQVQTALVQGGLMKLRSDGRPVLAKLPKDADEARRTAHAAASADWSKVSARVKAAVRAQDAAGARLVLETAVLDRENAILASFEDWLEEQLSSFTARLAVRMDAAHEHAARELERAEKGNPELPELRELVRLRKSYHRGVLITTLLLGVVAVFAIALPHLARDNDDLRLAWVRALVAEGSYPEWWVTLLIALGAWSLIVSLLLVVYYRGWSTFARRVHVAEFSAATRAQRARALRFEFERLESIHRQAGEWIELVTNALYDPWEVPSEWAEGAGSGLNPDRMPFAMAIGEAVEGTGTGSDRITRDAAAEFIRRGWRDQAFRELLGEIADRLGIDRVRLDPDALDSDLPEAPNNSRSLARQYMAKSDVLQGVAMRELSTIADGLQEDFQSGERISVAPLERADTMSAFQRSRSASSIRGWSEFLLEPILSSPASPPPLSALAIATHRVQQAHHEQVSSYVLGPEAVVERVAATARDDMTVRAVAPDAGLGFDALLRIDVVGPVPLDAVHALGGTPRTVPVLRPSDVPEESGI